MKKFQAPVIGGFRKMITLPPTSVGTTIAEVGSGTITLTQLAAAINNILQGSQSVTTGAAAVAANLVLGPGLAGGGTLVGNVPLRLTAPVPWGIMEDGADGDMGPPGPAGATGSTGPQGPQGIPGTGGSGSSTGLNLWIPEDTSYDDFLIPGPAGAAGAVGATGPQGPQGPAGSGTGSGGTGTTMFMVHDDAPYEEVPLGFPPPNVIGPYLNVEGPLSIYGYQKASGGGIALLTSALSGNPVPTIVLSGPGQANVIATNASSFVISQGVASPTYIQMQSGELLLAIANIVRVTIQSANPVISMIGQASATTLQVTGAAGFSALTVLAAGMQVGAPTGGTSGEMGSGTVNVSGNYFINGVPILGGAQSQALSGAFMAGDDHTNDDGFCQAKPTDLGPLTVNGLAQFTGGIITTGRSGLNAFAIFGAANSFAEVVHGSPTGGMSFGLSVRAGTNSADQALQVLDSSGILTYLTVYGDGGTVLGTGASPGPGVLRVNGATPSAAAGQTDIGVTTTATVITTSGGIALPALASTFWVVNVNGVKYGIPCFAL